MKNFLLDNYILIIDIIEVIAAISGSFYLSKTKNRIEIVFVYYLWLTVFVEIFGAYTHLLSDNYNWKWFIAIKNSLFSQNTWLYNIYGFLAIGLIGVFYNNLLKYKPHRLIVNGLFLSYGIFAFFYFILTDAFFKIGLPYDLIMGTFIVSVFVILYFLELIRSDVLLLFYRLPSFYISIALLFWYLSVTPLFIFDGYYKVVNSNFIEFRTLLLLFINVITYSCFTFGFLYPLYRKR